jgi:hypothetical protein
LEISVSVKTWLINKIEGKTRIVKNWPNNQNWVICRNLAALQNELKAAQSKPG